MNMCPTTPCATCGNGAGPHSRPDPVATLRRLRGESARDGTQPDLLILCPVDKHVDRPQAVWHAVSQQPSDTAPARRAELVVDVARKRRSPARGNEASGTCARGATTGCPGCAVPAVVAHHSRRAGGGDRCTAPCANRSASSGASPSPWTGAPPVRRHQVPGDHGLDRCRARGLRRCPFAPDGTDSVDGRRAARSGRHPDWFCSPGVKRGRYPRDRGRWGATWPLTWPGSRVGSASMPAGTAPPPAPAPRKEQRRPAVHCQRSGARQSASHPTKLGSPKPSRLSAPRVPPANSLVRAAISESRAR